MFACLINYLYTPRLHERIAPCPSALSSRSREKKKGRWGKYRDELFSVELSVNSPARSVERELDFNHLGIKQKQLITGYIEYDALNVFSCRLLSHLNPFS